MAYLIRTACSYRSSYNLHWTTPDAHRLISAFCPRSVVSCSLWFRPRRSLLDFPFSFCFLRRDGAWLRGHHLLQPMWKPQTQLRDMGLGPVAVANTMCMLRPGPANVPESLRWPTPKRKLPCAALQPGRESGTRLSADCIAQRNVPRLPARLRYTTATWIFLFVILDVELACECN